MRDIILVTGQSNATANGTSVAGAESARKVQLAPVPAWAQNAANGWVGHPTRSFDTNYEWPSPTLAANPCLYNEEDTGSVSGLTDGWGQYDGCNPSFGTHAGVKDKYAAELPFLSLYRQNVNPAIACLKASIGGIPISSFIPGGGEWAIIQQQWNQAVARLNSAGEQFRAACVLFIHGETGAYDVYKQVIDPSMGDVYMANLRTFIANTRSLTGRADLPFLIFRISSNMLDDYAINSQVAADPRYTAAQYRAAVNRRRWQQEQVAADPYCILVNEDGPPRLAANSNDFLHICGPGHLAFGERAWAAFSAYLGQTPPAPTATLSVSPASIVAGNSVTVTWTTTNATGATLDGNTVGLSGSQSFSPTANKTYTLLATGPGGTVTKTASVTVTQPPPPLVVNFNSTPQAWTVKLNGNTIGGPGDVIDITG